MKFKSFRADTVTAEGEIAGYGSYFGNRDSYGDVVERGAYRKSLDTWASLGKMPKLLWQHRSGEPIGVWHSMSEDDKGLRVRGKLITSVQRGREALDLLQAKAIDGLSIGYAVVSEKKDGDVNRLLEIDLREVSVVTDPANDLALIDEVKQRREEFIARVRSDDPPTIREFEGFLREAGFPKSMAATISACGYAKAVRRDADRSAEAMKAAFLQALMG